jgi:hypothetical protein
MITPAFSLFFIRVGEDESPPYINRSDGTAAFCARGGIGRTPRWGGQPSDVIILKHDSGFQAAGQATRGRLP